MKNKKINNYRILSLIILFIVLISTRFFNLFGSDTDWVNQHTVIPDYFRTLIYDTKELIPNFSLNYGGGQNIFNISYYGLLSPIILLSYAFPFVDMVTFLTIADIIILIGTAHLFYYFLTTHNFSSKTSLIGSIIFISSSSLIFHMHRHIMFVNYMPFLIMGLIGIDKYLKNKKCFLLVFSCFLMIMTSYYYSVCGILVLCIYYLYQYLNIHEKIEVKSFILDMLKFIFLILLAVISASVLILPTLKTLLAGRADSGSSINLLSLFIPNLKLANLFDGTYTIGLSMLAVISLLYLFFTKKRQNIVLGVILCVILFFPIFKYILNGGLYLREKCFIPFVPIFAYLIISLYDDLSKNLVDIKKLIKYLAIILIPLFIFNLKTISYLYVPVFFFVLYKYDKEHNHKLLTLFFVLVPFITMLVSNLTENYVSIKEYKTYFDRGVEKQIKDVLKKDKSIYRSNNLYYPTKTMNKIYASNYYTTNMYSSTYNKNYLDFVRDTFKNNRLEYNYFLIPASSNLLFNTFMGVKYLASDYNPGLGYEKIDKNIYQNNNVLPLMYASNNILSIEEFNKISYPNYLEVLLNNVVVGDISSNPNLGIHTAIYKPNFTLVNNKGVEIINKDNKYILKVEKEGNLKLKLNEPLKNKLLFINFYGLKENTCKIPNITMTINNQKNLLTCDTWIYANKNNTFRFLIAEPILNELNIELSKGTYNIENAWFYYLDYDYVKDIKSKKTEFNIKEFKNNKIKGDISVDDDSYFVTSIPYDEGFKVLVNGKVKNYEKVNKAFLGFKIDKGYNKIEITYNTPWLKIGEIVSLIGISIIIVIGVKEEIIDKKKKVKGK